MVELKDETDFAVANAGLLCGGEFTHRDIPVEDPTLGRTVQETKNVEKSGFARSRCTNKSDDFSCEEFEIDSTEDGELAGARAIGFVDSFGFE
jgi:hypothetical protein